MPETLKKEELKAHLGLMKFGLMPLARGNVSAYDEEQNWLG